MNTEYTKRSLWNRIFLRTTLILMCLLIPAAIFSGCGKDKSRKKPLTAVQVQPAAERSSMEGARYSASIMPYTQVNLAFKAGGYIQEILQIRGVDGKMRNAQEGDFIARGTVLAKVREADYLAKLNAARARLAEANASFTNARIEFGRATNLFKADSITEKEYDNTRARFDTAKAQVDAAQAHVDEAEISLQDCSLKAPMPLIILKRNIETGALVSHGATGFVVADTSSVKATFGVPDTTLRQLILGSSQTMAAEAFPGKEFRGLISAVSPSADSRSRIFDVEITIPNPGNNLKSGMIVSLVLERGKPMIPVVVVPLNAIVRPKDDPAGYAVYVIEEKDGKTFAHVRKIKVGEVFGNTVAVSEGIRAGERIIVTGATLVIDGEQVNIAL